MIVMNIFGLFLLLDGIVHSLASSSVLSSTGTHGWRTPVDCVKANEQCAVDSLCSSRYRTLRQCLAGRDRNTMLANKECQAALEVLQESPLYDCRCKRGMKRELQCLQIYWSIHLGLTEGEQFYETSPYEPVSFRLTDIFRLASISSGMDPTAAKGNHCTDTGKPCNACLDAAKACNLNNDCKKLRSTYISTCMKPVSPAEPCSRRKCHKALRQFFDRVSTEYSYRLLFCSCQEHACAERRRQMIVPSCSYEEKVKPNCLDLRNLCRTDHLCRSRLADFHMNCQTSLYSVTSCPNDNYQACLASYSGLIGFDLTPNYIDSSSTNITVSPWCSCKGSGNREEECEKFLRDFRDNSCLRNAIQAFGNGTDTNLAPKTPSSSVTQSVKTTVTEDIPKPSINPIDIKPGDDACVFPTCANLQESGPKCNLAKDQTFCLPEVSPSNPDTPAEPESFPKTGDINDRSVAVNFNGNAAFVLLSCLTVKLAF